MFYNRINADPHARIFNFWIALSDVITAPLGFVSGGRTAVVKVLPTMLTPPVSVTFVDMKKGDIVIFDTLQKIHGALPIVQEPANLRRSMEFRVIYSK